jgi:hypothetical protein
MKQKENIENLLMDFLLKDIIIKVDNKVVKQGRLKLVNIKQFFIKLNIEIDGVIKVFELPYPYKLLKQADRCVLDYTIESLSHGSKPIFSMLKNFKITNKPLKFYNSTIEILKS